MNELAEEVHLPFSPCSVECLSTAAQTVGYTNQKPEQHRAVAQLLRSSIDNLWRLGHLRQPSDRVREVTD